MLTVGLTGGFGCGKTTVLGFFKKCGVIVVSCDEIVHNEFLSNVALQKKIRTLWGESVFFEGKIDRKSLSKKIFKRAKDLKRLNSLMHPLVKKYLKMFFVKTKSKMSETIVVVEAPLLFEAGFDKMFDVSVGVKAADKAVIKRFSKNSRFTQSDFELRKSFQLPLVKKIALCDFVIDNNNDKKTTFESVKQLSQVLKNLEEKKWKN